MNTRLLRIGARASPLAEVQGKLIGAQIKRHYPNLEVSYVFKSTTGDQLKDVPLSQFGGKGLFCKELDTALLKNEVDVVVHSAKDIPVTMPEGICLLGFTQRADPRDVFIAESNKQTLRTLPLNALVGTASLRRQALLLHHRPDLRVCLFRGNVQTRLKKLAEGQATATLLAKAGLDRLNIQMGQVLDLHEFIPAVGQGALALTVRSEDATRFSAWLDFCLCPRSTLCVQQERQVMEALGANCQTPLGAHAELLNNKIVLRGVLSQKENLRRSVFVTLEGDVNEGLGKRMADKLSQQLTSF